MRYLQHAAYKNLHSLIQDAPQLTNNTHRYLMTFLKVVFKKIVFINKLVSIFNMSLGFFFFGFTFVYFAYILMYF